MWVGSEVKTWDLVSGPKAVILLTRQTLEQLVVPSISLEMSPMAKGKRVRHWYDTEPSWRSQWRRMCLPKVPTQVPEESIGNTGLANK